MKFVQLDNPPNPYVSEHREWLEPPPLVRLDVYEEQAGSILSENNSPDLSFRWSVNPYRGCQHACAYCYARPYHEYLGYGAGTDFDTKIVVKRNAPELLQRALSRRGWQGERIHFSGVTDCYQPLEASYKLTRGCLKVCHALANPVVVVTKGFLVVRDAALLSAMHRTCGAAVSISIPFADDRTAKLLEPQAPPPSRRFEAIARLVEAGVPVGVFISPVIPGLTDCAIPEILERAARAGARSAAMTPLRLPGSVMVVFQKRLRAVLPLRYDRVLSRLRDIRGGKLDERRFGRRMRGEGVYWDSVRDLFCLTRDRLGLATGCAPAIQKRRDQSIREGAQGVFAFAKPTR